MYMMIFLFIVTLNFVLANIAEITLEEFWNFLFTEDMLLFRFENIFEFFVNLFIFLPGYLALTFFLPIVFIEVTKQTIVSERRDAYAKLHK
jgi:hypothetical protein